MNQIDYRLESKLGPVRVQRRETVLRQTEVACGSGTDHAQFWCERVGESWLLYVQLFSEFSGESGEKFVSFASSFLEIRRCGWFVTLTAVRFVWRLFTHGRPASALNTVSTTPSVHSRH